MPIPCYQYIKIQGHDPRLIKGQIANLDFHSVPYVLEIEHLARNQFDTLISIEQALKALGFKSLPYSIYVIANCPEYQGFLYTIKSKEELPQFYNKRSKPLNTKENFFFNKIELKQTNFKNLVESEYMKSIIDYAKGHRKVSQKQNFLVYLETINKGLKEHYGKKE